MSDIEITQAEADNLIALEKKSAASEPIVVPTSGLVSVPILDLEEREQFQLDIRRARIDLKKGTNQMRTRQAIILVRLDFGGAPHRNPDGAEIRCPHVHFYREGFGDKWAFPLPEGKFSDIDNFWTTLNDFMSFCNIVSPPEFERGLF